MISVGTEPIRSILGLDPKDPDAAFILDRAKARIAQNEANDLYLPTNDKDAIDAAKMLFQTDAEHNLEKQKAWKFNPYPLQAQFMAKIAQPQKKQHLFVAHRRFGKTMLCAAWLLNKAYTFTTEGIFHQQTKEPRSPYATGRFVYTFPDKQQGKRVVWGYLREMGRKMGGVPNETELNVKFNHNGSVVAIQGCTDPDALRGNYIDAGVLDEWASVRNHESIWFEALEPQIRDYNGEVIKTGTVKGTNHMFHEYNEMKDDIERRGDERSPYTVTIFPNSYTRYFTDQELEPIKRLNYFAYRQEYECDWHAPIEGAFYGKLMRIAQEEKRVDILPIDNSMPVYTFWDVGRRDDTAVWFVQFPMQAGVPQIRLIDYLEGSGDGASTWARKVVDRARQRGYHFARKGHKLPHDADNKTWHAEYDGQKMLESNGIGVGQTEIIPKIGNVQTRIDQTREILPLCFFHQENCKKGIEKLNLYRRKYDRTTGKYGERPEHDENSHCADAFGTMAQWLNGKGSGYISNINKRVPLVDIEKMDIRPQAIIDKEKRKIYGMSGRNRMII